MKILSVVGKVDSRVLVYPLAKALSLSGLTAIVTDDGAYRRLFNGKGDIGIVSGVTVSVCGHVNDENMHSLDNYGIPYDYLLVVSSDFIPENANGIIACHGLDRSMMVKDDTDESDDFLISALIERGMKNKAANNSEDNKTSEELSSDELSSSEATEEVTESFTERLERLQRENPDKILIPKDKEFTEVQIAYAPVPKRGMAGIALKDGLVNYVYTCEEQKRLNNLASKDIVGNIAKIAAKPLGIDTSELNLLLNKEEGVGAPKKK